MSTAAATAVAFAVAAVLSFFVPRRVRLLLVAAVLVVPIALAAPKVVRAERHDAAASARGSRYSSPPGFRWRQANPALLRGIAEQVPAHASISVINAPLATGWIRWLAYSIAPRQLTDGPATWAIVFDETPEQAGLHHAYAWKYGRDWLVHR